MVKTKSAELAEPEKLSKYGEWLKTQSKGRGKKPAARPKGKSIQETESAESAEPKKLSKAGEWMRAHPNGLDVIYIDWKAVMK